MNDEQRVNEALMEKYHPDLCEREKRELDQYTRANDKEQIERDFDSKFVMEELRRNVNELKKENAMGDDRIPNEAIRWIVEAKGERLLELYNECWTRGLYPPILQRAKLKWLPNAKGGYRPISLLPALGKKEVT